jgi:hypothetical protein
MSINIANPSLQTSGIQTIDIYLEGAWSKLPVNEVSEDYLAQVITVTPEWAADVLANRNHSNRDEKLSYQNKLINSIDNGQFYMTNQGIGFYADGQLADGQNRLASIVKSNRAVQMVVVFGIHPDAKAAIDDGIKRSDVDIARLTGDRETPRRCIMIANTALDLTCKIKITDRFEKQKFYKTYMEGLKFTDDIFSTNVAKKAIRGITQAAVLAAVFRAYYNVRENPLLLDRLKLFVKILSDGMMVNPLIDRSAVLLRNMLIEETDGGVRSKLSTGYSRNTIYRKTERAIQKFLSNEPIDRLYEAKEELFYLPGEAEFFQKYEQ